MSDWHHHSCDSAGVAAVMDAIHTVQYLHLLPFVLGATMFFGFEVCAALLWGMLTLVPDFSLAGVLLNAEAYEDLRWMSA
jgi:hypothetical protein